MFDSSRYKYITYATYIIVLGVELGCSILWQTNQKKP